MLLVTRDKELKRFLSFGSGEALCAVGHGIREVQLRWASVYKFTFDLVTAKIPSLAPKRWAKNKEHELVTKCIISVPKLIIFNELVPVFLPRKNKREKAFSFLSECSLAGNNNVIVHMF